MAISRKIALVALVLCSVCLLLGCPSNNGTSSSRGDGGTGGGGDGDISSSDGDVTPTSDGTSATGGGEVEILEGWGHLKGRFSLTGAPAAGRITVTQDPAFCGKFGLVDERITVGKGGGLANVVVFLYLEKDQEPPQPHESYAADAEAEVVLDNKNCRFEPHVLLVRTTQKFKVTNSDPVSHNSKIEYRPEPLNQSIVRGQEVHHSFPIEQSLPSSVSCGSHPWMKAWIVVRESPYMALSDENGDFEIKNLPAGKWKIQFWHEDLGFIRKVTVGGKAAQWRKGLHEVTIVGADKTADLGELKLKMSDYPRT